MTDTPARDFLLPHLHAMLAEAVAQGIARDAAVAVLIDLVTGPDFNTTPLDPLQDTEPARGVDTSLEGEEQFAADAEAATERTSLTDPLVAYGRIQHY